MYTSRQLKCFERGQIGSSEDDERSIWKSKSNVYQKSLVYSSLSEPPVNAKRDFPIMFGLGWEDTEDHSPSCKLVGHILGTPKYDSKVMQWFFLKYSNTKYLRFISFPLFLALLLQSACKMLRVQLQPKPNPKSVKQLSGRDVVCACVFEFDTRSDTYSWMFLCFTSASSVDQKTILPCSVQKPLP